MNKIVDQYLAFTFTDEIWLIRLALKPHKVCSFQFLSALSTTMVHKRTWDSFNVSNIFRICNSICHIQRGNATADANKKLNSICTERYGNYALW